MFPKKLGQLHDKFSICNFKKHVCCEKKCPHATWLMLYSWPFTVLNCSFFGMNGSRIHTKSTLNKKDKFFTLFYLSGSTKLVGFTKTSNFVYDCQAIKVIHSDWYVNVAQCDRGKSVESTSRVRWYSNYWGRFFLRFCFLLGKAFFQSVCIIKLFWKIFETLQKTTKLHNVWRVSFASMRLLCKPSRVGSYNFRFSFIFFLLAGRQT